MEKASIPRDGEPYWIFVRNPKIRQWGKPVIPITCRPCHYCHFHMKNHRFSPLLIVSIYSFHVKNQVNQRVKELLREHGVEIAHWQHDLNIVQASEAALRKKQYKLVEKLSWCDGH